MAKTYKDSKNRAFDAALRRADRLGLDTQPKESMRSILGRVARLEKDRREAKRGAC